MGSETDGKSYIVAASGEDMARFMQVAEGTDEEKLIISLIVLAMQAACKIKLDVPPGKAAGVKMSDFTIFLATGNVPVFIEYRNERIPVIITDDHKLKLDWEHKKPISTA